MLRDRETTRPACKNEVQFLLRNVERALFTISGRLERAGEGEEISWEEAEGLAFIVSQLETHIAETRSKVDTLREQD